MSCRPLWHVVADFVFGRAFVSRGVPSLVLVNTPQPFGLQRHWLYRSETHRDVSDFHKVFFDGRQFGAEIGTSRVRYSMMVASPFSVSPTIITPLPSSTAVGFALDDKGAIAVLGTTACFILLGSVTLSLFASPLGGGKLWPRSPGADRVSWRPTDMEEEDLRALLHNSFGFTHLSRHEAMLIQRRRQTGTFNACTDFLWTRQLANQCRDGKPSRRDLVTALYDGIERYSANYMSYHVV